MTLSRAEVVRLDALADRVQGARYNEQGMALLDMDA